MKQKLLYFLILLLGTTAMNAQRNCGSMEYLQQQLESSPERVKNLEIIERQLQEYQRGDRQSMVVTIPVVFHVVYRTSSENISTAQLQTQLDVLNEDFRRLNSDADGTWPQAADVEIEFCLATVDPNGNPTSGITRTSTSVNGFGTNDAVKFASSGGKDAWPSSDYLNFWVCNIGGGILGYAQFPGGPANTDGVVNDYRYTGTIGTATAPFDLGRTATHEVGHWLNLRHIWGDGPCSQDDFVSDTPTSDAPNYGCASGHVSCGSTDMVQNYMDYSDDACMNLFTQGQKTRMQALFGSGGFRASLLSSNGCGTASGPTCSDGIQNGNETGVDCGGPDCAACPTCNDGVQNGNETGVDCGGPDCVACQSNCTSNEVTVTINLDNYPEETSWAIVNSSGATVASGGTYGAQPDGSTVTIVECLPNGCYDFTINDSYGDGICCAYGNGSYTVTSGGSTLASGGSFGSSETTNFCLGSSAPTCTDGVQNGNETGVDCGGPDCAPCATCNDGVQNGNETGVDCGGPDCAACPTCNDGVQNGSETGIDCGGPDCAPCGGTGTTVLSGDFFETGWDGWIDGGSDCFRYSGSRSWEGSYSIRLRDNSGNASAMTSAQYNLSGYSSVDVEFYFYAWSMENGEDFFVEYNDGSGWQIVASYARGANFDNNTFYVATVNLDGANYNLNNGSRFRFRCDASGNSDHVYIDAVTITGNGSGTRQVNGAVITALETVQDVDAKYEELTVLPNPTSDKINIYADMEISNVKIFSITGQLMFQSDDASSFSRGIDVSAFNSGLYILTAETDGEIITKRFVKQ